MTTMKIPLTFEDLTVGLKVIANDSEYEGTVASIETNRVYLREVKCLKTHCDLDNIKFYRSELGIEVKLYKIGEIPNDSSIQKSSTKTVQAKKTAPEKELDEETLINGVDNLSVISCGGDLSPKEILNLPPISSLITETCTADLSVYPHFFFTDVQSAISILKSLYGKCDQVGLRAYANDFSVKNSLSMICMKMGTFVYCFDLLEIKRGNHENERLLVNWLAMYFKNERIKKIMHDCRFVSYYLYNQYKIELKNVIDLDVAYQILHRDTYKEYPKLQLKLAELMRDHLNLSAAELNTIRHVSKLNCDWSERPLSHELKNIMLIENNYLIDLYQAFLEKSNKRLVRDCDIYLTIVRNCEDPKQLQSFFENQSKSFLKDENLRVENKTPTKNADTHNEPKEVCRQFYSGTLGEHFKTSSTNDLVENSICSELTNNMGRVPKQLAAKLGIPSSQSVDSNMVDGLSRSSPPSRLLEYIRNHPDSASMSTHSICQSENSLNKPVRDTSSTNGSDCRQPVTKFECSFKSDPSNNDQLQIKYSFKPAGFQPSNYPKRKKNF